MREDPQRAELLGYDVRKYQLADVRDRQRPRGLERRSVHVLGPIHHAVQHRPAGGGDAHRMGGVLRTQRSDRDPGRIVPAAVRFQTITIYSQQAALVLMGALLLATVMFVPQGFVFGIGNLLPTLATSAAR